MLTPLASRPALGPGPEQGACDRDVDGLAWGPCPGGGQQWAAHFTTPASGTAMPFPAHCAESVPVRADTRVLRGRLGLSL